MGNIPSDEYWGNQLPRLINYGKHGRLNLRSIKLFADGIFFFFLKGKSIAPSNPLPQVLLALGALLYLHPTRINLIRLD